MQIIRKNWIYLLGTLLGAASGYLYWRYVGCSSGACPITSSPIISTFWGALTGAVLGGTIKYDKVNKNK